MTLTTLLMVFAVVCFLFAALFQAVSLAERPVFRINPLALGLLFWATSILLGSVR